MKNPELKSDLLKQLMIALVCVLLAFTNTAFANGKGDKKSQKKVTQKSKVATTTKAAKKLTAEEVKFYNEIEQYYQEEIKKPANKLVPTFDFTKIVVYAADGSTVQTQTGELDLEKLPKGATKLFVENGVAYYYIF